MRRSQALVSVLALATGALALPSRATSDLNGSIAVQPTAPVRVVTCAAVVNGSTFSPRVSFATDSLAVDSWIVRMVFFDAANVSTGTLDVADAQRTFTVPPGSTSMTCAIVREILADGTLFVPGSTAVDTRGGTSGLALIALLAGQGSLATSTPKAGGTRASARPCAFVSPSPVATSQSATATASTAPANSISSAEPTATPGVKEGCR